MREDKLDYTSSYDEYTKELQKEGLILCFINNNEHFFKSCLQHQMSPKRAIRVYKNVNKVCFD